VYHGDHAVAEGADRDSPRGVTPSVPLFGSSTKIGPQEAGVCLSMAVGMDKKDRVLGVAGSQSCIC
jgi:hypothetical protein